MIRQEVALGANCVGSGESLAEANASKAEAILLHRHLPAKARWLITGNVGTT
jgi:hypothetical protein